MSSQIVLYIWIIVTLITQLDVVFSYTKSQLTEIKLNNPKNEQKGYTYEYANFMYHVKVNEQILKGVNEACYGECSSNLTKLPNSTYSNGEDNAYCNGDIYDCTVFTPATSSQNNRHTVYVMFPVLNGILGRSYTSYNSEYCATCRCYCDEFPNRNTVNLICLDAVSSNIAEKYVVTGVRFVVVDSIIRLQIQQSKILGYSMIDSKTARWQKLDIYCNNIATLSYNHRMIQLDDIILADREVVTGLSFQIDDMIGRIYLSVRGKLSHQLQNSSIAITVYNPPIGSRSNLMSTHITDSTLFNGEHSELSVSGEHYVTFQPPYLQSDTIDANKKLMPFLDIRNVTSQLWIKPLRGVGIYWRSHPGYGGYLSLKLFVVKS